MTTKSMRVATRLAVLAFVLAACATPGVVPRGESASSPQMADDAFVMSDGMRLPLRVWAPADVAEGKAKPRAIVIGVHGMNDYSNAFDMPGSYFTQRGIVTYAYDQRCFGRAAFRGQWAGTPTLIDDLNEVTRLVRARHPGVPVYLFGLSMGGAVVLASAEAGKLPPVDGVIFSAPAVWGWQAMNIAYKIVLWTGAHVMPGKTLSGSRLTIWPSDNMEMLRAFSRDPLVIKETRIGTIYGLVGLMDRGYDGADDLAVPTLLLYGAKDEIVPEEPVHAVARRVPGPLRMITYAHGYHMLERDLQRETVYRDIEAWIADHKAPMPSIAGRSPPVAAEADFGAPAAAATND